MKNKKIKCPVCSTINDESQKHCINEKCKFELTYAKEGSYVGISDNDLKMYNTKLSIAKEELQKKQDEENKKTETNKTISEKNYTQPNPIKLINLKKDAFESISEFNQRLISHGYIQIGTYDLESYDAEKEQYKIKINIQKNQNQNFQYDFTKITKLNVNKERARKIGIKNGLPLLAKISLGVKAKMMNKLHEINKSSKGIIEPIIDGIDYDENNFRINFLKFDECNFEIKENELLDMIKNNWVWIAAAVGLVWMGV